MKNNILRLFILLFTTVLFSQSQKVVVEKNDEGMKLLVDGKPFMINGMNWDYVPIGTNVVNADFYKKSDDIIKAGLDAEMALLQNMNVNVIRQYTGVPSKWVKYIYENYGVYTMLNDSFGRYGLTIDGVWTPVTDYSDARTQEILLSTVQKLATDYKNTPGLLLYLLGNENNYGLFWAGAETEDFPDGEEKINAVGELRGRPMYRLMNEATKLIKSVDPSHPVAICNGDDLFIDIVAEECKDIDIYGTNSYRGVSFGNLFQTVKDKMDKPIMFTEFGSDAFNAKENQEDQRMQAYYMLNNWKEIYENAAGLGKVGNSIGGFTFQFSDGWWKAGFDDRKDADTHQTESTWNAGGYTWDEEFPGANNMNEEWFGICAKGPTNERGLYTLYPRASYYALKDAHNLNPYAEGMTLAKVDNYFNDISLTDAMLRARGDKATLEAKSGGKIKLSSLRAEFTTFSTGGKLIDTPEDPIPFSDNYPDQLGFDHMESYFVGVEGSPSPNMKAEVNVNILGNVATNPIDEIFYENRGRTATTNDGELTLSSLNRVQVYNASYEWNAKDFDLRGFYRTGHYHWGYEGDFFGLYPEANYGPNLDIYSGEISGFEVDGKKSLKGLKLAFGPQLWWGANPALLAKYSKDFKGYHFTGIFHEDLGNNTGAATSSAIPQPRTRRATLHVEKEFGKIGVQLGGIWGGQPLNGREFQIMDDGIVKTDKVQASDNWGGKIKVMYEGGKFNWYAQAAAMGLVANGGADYTRTFTGWKLKDTGSGNQTNFLTGFTLLMGDIQIAPNFLWQKPIVDAMPDILPNTGRKRNILDDPFSVIWNREMVAGELLFTWDPTPGTWMYEWDNDRREDAKLALSAGVVFRRYLGARDSKIGFDDAGRTPIALAGGTPDRDLWEVHTRVVSKLTPDFGIIANLYAGNGEPNSYVSSSKQLSRLIDRIGGDIRVLYKKLKVTHSFKLNDWGPYDYHRDFNLTYPVQLMLDVSTSLGKPDWFILPDTRIGIRGTWRSLDEFSNRYSPNSVIPNTFPPVPVLSPVGFDDGQEWEIRTYIHINIGK